jgi:hypothetical protein
VFGKSKTWDKPFSEKISKRVSKIPTSELEGWAEQSIYTLGRLLSAYRSRRDDQSLEELVQGAEALHAVVDEIGNRNSKIKL